MTRAESVPGNTTLPSQRHDLGIQLPSRHADAGDPAKWDGPDSQRPLSGKGRKQAERLGAFLDAHGIEPDAIVSSPRLRAQETAEVVADALGMTGPKSLEEEIAELQASEKVDAELEAMKAALKRKGE